MKELKIFEIETNGEKTWIAARSLIEALQTMITTTSISIHDFDHEDEIKEVDKSVWKDYKVTDEYGVVELSFEQWMGVNKSPDIIASTAY